MQEVMEKEIIETEAPKTFMTDFLNKTPAIPEIGDLVEGVVMKKDKTAVFVDLGIFGVGIIYGREFLNAKDVIKKTKVGETITAKVVDSENEDGYMELSLREAKRAVVWHDAELAMKNKETIELPVKEANRGGLMLEWKGLVGFLPASQLKPDHYPRVEDRDKERIAEELRKLVGEKLLVSIISIDPEEDKLIFSEKTPSSPERQKIISKYAVGDVVEGTVTGVVEFGVFVRIEEGLEGLVHISELDWGLVENPRDFFNVGNTIKAKIIEIKDEKISLSVKALTENPWKKTEGKYKKGDIVSGVVIRFNKYGALVSVEEGVAGLIHVSEFTSMQDLHNTLELGKTYDFQIKLFEPKEQKMTLVFKKEETTTTES
jgi:ribosomal protein S1